MCSLTLKAEIMPPRWRSKNSQWRNCSDSSPCPTYFEFSQLRMLQAQRMAAISGRTAAPTTNVAWRQWADRDHDRAGHGDRLHQRHINPRMHVSRWVCGRMWANVTECGGYNFAKTKACRLRD